jgi:hypothetical protein
VNADDPGHENLAVQLLWAHLAVYIAEAHKLFSQWPGLFYKVIHQILPQVKVEKLDKCNALGVLSFNRQVSFLKWDVHAL